MGRKVNRFRCVIPNSLMDYVGVDSRGYTSRYKVAHFLSILTNHIMSNYPSGNYFLKKPITAEYLSFLYTLRYTKQVIFPLRTDGIIQVNDSYSTDLGFCKEYGFNKDIIQEVIDEEYTEVYITKNTLINRINDWQRETLNRQIKKYRFIETEADMLLNLIIDSTALEQLYSQRIEDIKQSSDKKKKLAMTNATRHKEEILQLTEARDLLDARVRYISGRVYHPFVQCPREYRKAVVDEQGEPFVEVDLRSSQAVFLCKVIAVALKHRLITYEFGKQATATDNLIEQIIPLLDEPINVLEKGIYPSDFTAFVSAVFLDDIYEDASPENISQNASVQVGEDVYEVGGYARVSGTKTLVGEARKEAKDNGELVTNEFVYVDYNGNFTDTPPDPAEKEKISAESIIIGIPKSENVKKDGYTGKVSFFDHSKGFGFIVDPETQEQFFVHISECIDEIKEGNKVSFDTVKGTKGLNAVKVKVIG